MEATHRRRSRVGSRVWCPCGRRPASGGTRGRPASARSSCTQRHRQRVTHEMAHSSAVLERERERVFRARKSANCEYSPSCLVLDGQFFLMLSSEFRSAQRSLTSCASRCTSAHGARMGYQWGMTSSAINDRAITIKIRTSDYSHVYIIAYATEYEN